MLETKKFQELEMVELLEDLSEYDLKKGEIGVVVEVFETPSEAYDLEFVDESGRSSRFAYSVRPDQIKASEGRRRKANLFDVVEVAEDMPEYGAKRGEHGVVVEVLDDPEEGYVLEFGDPSGTSSRLAHWVKPEQIKRATPRKVQELEVVELIEDLPEYSVKKGERAVVTTAFSDPDEAYDLEFVDESGTSSRFAYSVKPNQIRTQEEIAKEAFGRGMELLNSGPIEESEREFREAIALKPSYVGLLNNLFGEAQGGTGDWKAMIGAMRFLIRLDPSYKGAWKNLAISYLNYGVRLARESKVEESIALFLRAMSVPSSDEIVEDIRTNLAAAHTTLGIRAHEGGLLKEALTHMLHACACQPNETTRSNLGLAYTLHAEALMVEEKFSEAIASFERAQDSGFISAECLNNYGLALARESRFPEATTAFEGALRLVPGDERVLANLRCTHEKRTIDLQWFNQRPNFDPGPGFSAQQYQPAA